jgi:hypothetical protein
MTVSWEPCPISVIPFATRRLGISFPATELRQPEGLATLRRFLKSSLFAGRSLEPIILPITVDLKGITQWPTKTL